MITDHIPKGLADLPLEERDRLDRERQAEIAAGLERQMLGIAEEAAVRRAATFVRAGVLGKLLG